ncbi:hypothetical protein ACIBO5_52265 [Nonomuraea angiospora]|uniref:hypothetical protein n=1 Tax=Nonomuraea angiospora TaxID=46172 RepID=UPI0029AAF069|nr:hypothetical protein [Nonomuraea angiospora]MDX3110310.1 hypothetical protein [Nonomuraea angiospora]
MALPRTKSLLERMHGALEVVHGVEVDAWSAAVLRYLSWCGIPRASPGRVLLIGPPRRMTQMAGALGCVFLQCIDDDVIDGMSYYS